MIFVLIHLPIPVVCAKLIHIAKQEILILSELIYIKGRLIRFGVDGPVTHIDNLIAFCDVSNEGQLKKGYDDSFSDVHSLRAIVVVLACDLMGVLGGCEVLVASYDWVV